MRRKVDRKTGRSANPSCYMERDGKRWGERMTNKERREERNNVINCFKD